MHSHQVSIYGKSQYQRKHTYTHTHIHAHTNTGVGILTMENRNISASIHTHIRTYMRTPTQAWASSPWKIATFGHTTAKRSNPNVHPIAKLSKLSTQPFWSSVWTILFHQTGANAHAFSCMARLRSLAIGGLTSFKSLRIRAAAWASILSIR